MSAANKVNRLTGAIVAVCPIGGLSVGTIGDSASVVLQFTAAATGPQQAAANSALTGFDWSDAADAAWIAQRQPDLANARDAAQAALDNNATYLAIVAPTQAQAAAQVKALTQQSNQIIRALKLLAVAALG